MRLSMVELQTSGAQLAELPFETDRIFTRNM